MRVFLTGATGCVGVYLLRQLLAQPGVAVVAQLRDPARLPRDLAGHPGLTLVQADLRETSRIAAHLAGVDAALLVATSWGGTEAMAVTCGANLALTDALIAQGCGHILYFATASVLDRSGAMLPAARDLGTDYIKAKYALVEGMEARAGLARITGLFPTIVVGGDAEEAFAPRSHFARLLPQVARWIGLIRFLQVKAALHLIHAQDIATVVAHLLTRPEAGALRLVLGNPQTSANGLIEEAAAYLGTRRRALVTLRPALAEALIRLFRIQLSPWDRYCMLHPDQAYDAPVNPAAYGLKVAMPDLATGFRLIGLPPKTGAGPRS